MSIVPVPSGSVFAYNGWTFGPYTKTRFIEKPITSADNRTVKFSELTFNTSGWLTQVEADAANAAAGGSLDAAMVSLRRKLQVHGKRLQFVNYGMGKNLDIGGTGPDALRDCNFGPKAGQFTWQSLGGAPLGCHGAMFEWSVTTWLPECATFTFGPGVFVEIACTASYDVGEDGLVTITYAGSAQIPMSLRSDGTFERNIDDELAGIINFVPEGFRRKIQRTLSADRASVRFSIVDRQIEVAHPDDVVTIDMRQSISQDRPFAPLWTGSITGTLRMDPMAPKVLAYHRFMNIATQRILTARNMILPGMSNQILPGVLKMEEDLFRNESRFSLGFKLIGKHFGIENIVENSGMWRPLINASNPPMQEPWTARSSGASLAGRSQYSYGYLRARFNNSLDVIVDPCSGPAPEANLTPSTSVSQNQAAQAAEDESPFDDDMPTVTLSPADGFTATATWVDWHCILRRLAEHNVVRHKPLSGTVSTQAPDFDLFGQVDSIAADKFTPKHGWTASVPDMVQQVASPSLRVLLSGYGIRVNYRVNPPKLLNYGGKAAILEFEDVQEQELGISEGVIVYRTDWDLVYLIPDVPADVPFPANVSTFTDGSEGQMPELQSGIQG
jgi:hypothetical protein